MGEVTITVPAALVDPYATVIAIDIAPPERWNREIPPLKKGARGICTTDQANKSPSVPLFQRGKRADTGPDIFVHALQGERTRAAQQVARFRFIAVTLILAINLVFFVLNPTYIGPPLLPLALYSLAAGAILVARGRYAVAERWRDLAIPCIDMPLALVLIAAVIARLRVTPYAGDAASVATQLPLFYLLLILAASLSLDERQTWRAAGVAVLLQSGLLVWEGRHPSFVVIVALATALGTSLTLYARRRSVALVRVAAVEQTRREQLGRYFSPQVAAAVADGNAEIGRGERRDVSVLFADLRDFTAMSEALSGEQVVALLNDFHARMVDEIFAAGGTLDKYLGDGLMAYFGAPVAQADHADRAVRCALAMQAALAGVNEIARQRGAPALRMGIGIHSGSVILGDIGAARRREYTIIGDTVNVAARIEQLTKNYGAAILVSEATKDLLTTVAGLTTVEPVTVKGKAHPLQTYRVDATPVDS
jgi:adenylate cyclase